MTDKDTRSLEVVKNWQAVSPGATVLPSKSISRLQTLINNALDEQDKITRHRCADVVARIGGLNTAREREIITEAVSAIMNSRECHLCADPNYLPEHRGSSMCQSGSLASGGNRVHCTCDYCF